LGSVPEHRSVERAALLTRATLDLALRPHSGDFALGWRLCNASFFPSLERFGAVGHLGFTGTSAFLFPRSQTIFVLLTNRVHPRRDAAPSRLPLLGQAAELVATWG
jgi:CubicO group peptidase (beta-lactamase class C family)